MFDYLSFSFILVSFVGGFATGITMGLAYAQTPTTVQPSTSGLQFVPQQAWVQTVPPQGVQTQSSGDLQEMIIPIVITVVGFIAAKFNADKNHKANAAEILKNKENTKELARVTYDMNPEAAAKIDDAPSVKIQTLTTDAQEYAEKVAKK